MTFSLKWPIGAPKITLWTSLYSFLGDSGPPDSLKASNYDISSKLASGRGLLASTPPSPYLAPPSNAKFEANLYFDVFNECGGPDSARKEYNYVCSVIFDAPNGHFEENSIFGRIFFWRLFFGQDFFRNFFWKFFRGKIPVKFFLQKNLSKKKSGKI